MLLAAGLLLFVLSAALPQLNLQPGMPLPSVINGQIYAPPKGSESPSASLSLNLFLEVLFGLLLAGSLVYLLYKLISGVAWRDYWLLILKTLGLITGAFFLLFLLFLILSSKAAPLSTLPLPLPTPEPQVRTPLGPVPPLILWIAAMILTAAATLLGVWIYETFSNQSSPLNLLALEAEKARQALLTGENVKDVILRCYQQMGLVIKLDQGIERPEYMTPREFENQLAALGMPPDPIHQLTLLFEAVRYGNWRSNALDEDKALACLEAIALCSQKMKPAQK